MGQSCGGGRGRPESPRASAISQQHAMESWRWTGPGRAPCRRPAGAARGPMRGPRVRLSQNVEHIEATFRIAINIQYVSNI